MEYGLKTEMWKFSVRHSHYDRFKKALVLQSTG